MPQSSSDTPSSSFNSLSIIVYFLIVLIVMLIIALVIFFIRRRRSGYKIPQEIMDINPSPHIHLNSLSPSALHSTNNSLLNRENGQRSPPYTQSSRQSQSYPMAQQTTSNNSRINPSVVVVQPHQSTNNNRFTTPITPNLPPQPRQTRRQPSILLRRTPTHNSHSMMPPDETADMVPESQLVSAMTLDGDEVPSHIPSEVLSTDTVYYQPGARRRN
ncbi:hypothetical protein BC833DRAFT_568738 [Globomyces pollinis-pini]|nr:hypothetical protein BC833DRAFT_568738 [Globomyces pollinis-pini]